MTRRMETLFLAGPAGRLEALLEEPGAGEPRAAALVLHPHPLGGGTMHNKVVYRMARALRELGLLPAEPMGLERILETAWAWHAEHRARRLAGG